MKVLITGAAGFVGRNLAEALAAIRDGKDRTHPELAVDGIFLCDVDTPASELDRACAEADFVVHLAGVNRPQDPADFVRGNRDALSSLLDLLRAHGNTCPVLLSSSLQATLIGRYDSDYGRSKRAGEDLLFAYAEETGARALVYRFPNLFGKWCRPNYNSAVATFCHNVAHDLPLTVSDPAVSLTLLYIDDLIAEVLCAMAGREHRVEYRELEPVPTEGGRFCAAPVTHTVTLGEIVALLARFRDWHRTLVLPSIPDGSFAKKLYSTYLSYLPEDKVAVSLTSHADHRGSFTELLKTEGAGQFSVNVSLPGITKGEHWHHTKWELFIVVSGRARIEQRRVGDTHVLSTEVSGACPTAVHMLPGYTHRIVNLSDTEELITLMWANETFDPTRPDTFYEPVYPNE